MLFTATFAIAYKKANIAPFCVNARLLFGVSTWIRMTSRRRPCWYYSAHFSCACHSHSFCVVCHCRCRGRRWGEKGCYTEVYAKRHCVVHSDFSPLEHNRTGYLLTTELTWYSGSYTRRTAGCLSHSRFCLAS